MNPTRFSSMLNRGVQLIRYRLEEFMHVCAIYLGIAVLVTIAAGSVVPSMREQASQLYTVVVEALRPAALEDDGFSQLGWFASSVDPEVRANIHDDNQKDGINASAYQAFAEALQVSAGTVNIAGVSRTQLQALRSYIARKYKVAHSVSGALIHTAFRVGHEKNIDPQLILAIIAIESSYNPFAESHAGAQGLMQVMTRVHKDKLEDYTEGDLAVFSPEANIRAGTQILYDCRRRRGSLTGALSCYVGATGPSDGGYGARVLAERRRMALASGIAVRNE
ncbi:transglycosylase SLT domain-containing protein [Paenalcaligenes niemegkensis]|uniref:transglycosylase SLT domain-containing protein n=1 Tax=Paenalcaligenes niemegkensis TaxID=2895469 RepID=UPI001EE99C88|nr:transglycosylase SLT domain-containing protein [Paenalcaligenes niemegkensis]MCQ9617154.1 transglycosylase SLT domain-containing protein [Paenalcaligenes niemegkensis]